MPKPVNCCVPGCFNNFRNSSGLQYYRIPKDSFLRKEYKRLLRNETLKLNSDNTRICSTHFEGGKKRDRNQLPSFFPWSKPTAERRELKRVNQTEVKIQRKRRKVTNHNTVLHEELRESGMQPACNSILEASEAGFHHCCVSFASVGTQTDEPMDLRRKKFQELYFVVYLTVILRGRAGYELIYITNEAVGRVGYYQLISGKSEKNNCFSKFSSNSLDFFG